MKRMTFWRRPTTRTIRAFLTALFLVGTVFAVGCVQVPVAEQRLVSKPNAVFDDFGTFVYDTGPYAQSEPGSTAALASSGAGCTACR